MEFDKDVAYYEGLDKRTKEYKEWKEWHSKQSEGLGDDISKVTEALGVDKAAKAVSKALGFDDCGCDSRKEKLNKLFHYAKPECFTEDEFNYLSDFFAVNRTRVSYPERQELYAIYNRVFNQKLKVTNCPSCYRDVANKLKKLIQAHRE